MTKPYPWLWLAVALLAIGDLASPTFAQTTGTKYTLQVDGLACPFCAYGIEKKFNAIDGVASVETDIKSGTVTIHMKVHKSLDATTARKAVEAAGFTMRAFKQEGTGG